MKSWLGQAQRCADAVQALMMATMFCAFIAQVLFRYLLNLPLAWTEEVCTLVWLWGVLWGASFVMRNRDDIRFDLVYTLLPTGARRWLTVVSSTVVVVLLLASLPASWSYVSFMKVERTASLGLGFHLVFSVYIVFILATAVRHSHMAYAAWRGELLADPEFVDSAQAPR